MNAIAIRSLARSLGIFLFTLSLLLSSAQPLSFPEPTTTDCVAVICQLELPEATWLLTYSDEQGYGTCDCPPAAGNASGLTTDPNLRRRQQYSANWTVFASRVMRMAPTEGCPDENVRVRRDWAGTTTASGSQLCQRDEVLLQMFDSVRTMDLAAQFQLSIQEAACEMHFPRFFSSDEKLVPYGRNRLTLTFPRRFLDDASVGDELLLFMLLHEVGHGTRGSEQSLPADDWAARVGAALYFKERWTPAFAMSFLNQVVTQLAAFVSSQERAEFMGRPSPEDNEGEEYPALGCRLNLIRGAYLNPSNGLCNSYGAPCFSNRLTGHEGSIVRGSYNERSCSPTPRPINDLPEKKMLSLLEDLCARYPALCDRPSIDPVRVKRGIRVNARQLLDALRKEHDLRPRPSNPPTGN